MNLLRLSMLGLAVIVPAFARGETTGAALTRARDTTTIQTGPAGRATDATVRRSAAQRARGDAAGDRLSRGICIGCNAR